MNEIEITCPKCDGRGYLDAFRHIDNGRCFRCAGNRTILVAPEKASAERIVFVVPPPPTAEIPGLGRVDVYDDRIEVPGQYGGLPVYFERRDGRVVVTGVANGLRARKAQVIAAVERWAA